MLSCSKQVRIGYGKGKRGYVTVTREHYLREDITCKVEGCPLCEEHLVHSPQSAVSCLSPRATHYLIPDTPVLTDYLEVIEHHAINGVILLQTPLAHIRSKKGQRRHKKIVSLLGKSDKHCAVFSNENHFETWEARGEEQSARQWQQRLILRAGVWYCNHIQACGQATQVVIVTTDGEYQSFPKPDHSDNVMVIGLRDYLSLYLPSHQELHQLYEALTQTADVSNDSSVKSEFSPYISDSAIKSGLLHGVFVSGTLQVSKYRPRDEAYVRRKSCDPNPSDDETQYGEVLVYGRVSRNRALHGDTVAVRILPEAQWLTRSGKLADSADSPVLATGVVVGVVSRQSREYVATFEESGEGGSRSKTTKVLVYPYDVRVPKIRLSTRQAEELSRHRIVVRIDSWEVDSQYPSGHFVRSIGPIGSLETETQVILIEHELASSSFSTALLNELPVNSPDYPWLVAADTGRRDLRDSHLVFSIDPQGCEDVDDTLSVRKLRNGRTELGVHIADVSHFVKPGSLTDKEASQRSTTVYLADRRYDMLPAVLSADLCSLLSNVDRYAVSVIWQLDESYRVVKVWYGRTIIRSKYKLAYETAQALFDGASVENVLTEIPELQQAQISEQELLKRIGELREAIGGLVTISRVLKHRRAMEGALELESVEVKVQISDTDKTDIEDLVTKDHLEVHEVIAECMIFANHWVAKRIHQAYPTQALLRHHPPPSADRVAQLIEAARVRGFTVTADSNKAFAESLDRCQDPKDPMLNKIMRNLATQAMNQAAYFSTGSLSANQFSHYGLALDLYTHFTSPIRRYADLVVHRQLLSALEVPTEDPKLLPGTQALSELTQHMNSKHRSAQIAQLASTELFQCLYFSSMKAGDGRSLVEGVVTGVRYNGVYVFVPRYGIRSLVYLADKTGLVLQTADSAGPIYASGSIALSAHGVTVNYGSNSYTLNVFDHVLLRVTVETSHAHGLGLTLNLVECSKIEPGGMAGGSGSDGNKALIESVRRETEEAGVIKYSQQLQQETEFGQSPSENSLYCLTRHFQKLSLADDTL